MVTEDKINSSWIDSTTYDTIVELMPIACVDMLFTHKNSFLLCKRVNDPGKGEWFYPGGRVYKGESLKDAVVRKAKEELGISVSTDQINFLTTEESIFKGKTIDENRHSINNIYKIELNEIPTFSYDKKQTSVLQWFTKIDGSWHPYIKESLVIAGFK